MEELKIESDTIRAVSRRLMASWSPDPPWSNEDIGFEYETPVGSSVYRDARVDLDKLRVWATEYVSQHPDIQEGILRLKKIQEIKKQIGY